MRPLTIASSTVALVGALVAALFLAGLQPFAPSWKGRAERSAALCPQDMVWIPAGSFYAGATGEEVQRSDLQPDIVIEPRPRAIRSTDGYCIDRHEWPGAGRLPVADVTWIQARASCRAVGKRLCSEDEWTKACGGVLGWNQPYGPVRIPGLCHAELIEEARYDLVRPGGSQTQCRSPWGIYDQEGNVSEWVADGRQDMPNDRWVLGGTMWRGVYGRGCQARHAHLEMAPVAGDDGFRCCRSLEVEVPAGD